jgi:hypothetical protein
MEDFHHISVMPDEILEALAPRSGGIYVDGTLGGAGHAGLVLTASSPDGILIGFDRDAEAIAVAPGCSNGIFPPSRRPWPRSVSTPSTASCWTWASRRTS